MVNQEVRRMHMRSRVARWGLHVRCLVCTVETRHRPEKDGRLRDRTCPGCGHFSLRTTAWIRRYPDRAAKLVAEWRQGEGRVQLDAIRSLETKGLRKPDLPS